MGLMRKKEKKKGRKEEVVKVAWKDEKGKVERLKT